MITYCTNIHPGESWEETFAALRAHVPAVVAAVAGGAPFPIGLRLSNRASEELAAAGDGPFTEWLQSNGCFVPTLNGFPYGAFHGDRVKERVYLPDWRSRERVAYTTRLADLLARWLPEGMPGSISSVPIGLKGSFPDDADLPLVRENLVTVLTHLHRIVQEQGKEISLALEPEPGCVVETTAEAIRFLAGMDLPVALSDHLALCYDCCHQAVEFESPEESLAQLAAAGVRIAKVQVSLAPSFVDPSPETLARFVEPRYLHQVVVRRGDGSLARYLDLPEASEGHRRRRDDEWRCHFHLPIFLADTDPRDTTGDFLTGLLPLLPEDLLLEIETYTWDALPTELRCATVTDSIVREFRWLEERFDAAHRRP